MTIPHIAATATFIQALAEQLRLPAQDVQAAVQIAAQHTNAPSTPPAAFAPLDKLLAGGLYPGAVVMRQAIQDWQVHAGEIDPAQSPTYACAVVTYAEGLDIVAMDTSNPVGGRQFRVALEIDSGLPRLLIYDRADEYAEPPLTIHARPEGLTAGGDYIPPAAR